jgi:hypothetical protein
MKSESTSSSLKRKMKNLKKVLDKFIKKLNINFALQKLRNSNFSFWEIAVFVLYSVNH